jgi:hypothetical protein
MFVLDKTSEYVLKQKLQLFHGLFSKSKLQSHSLEELLYESIKTSPNYRNKIVWKSGSHFPDYDYIIEGSQYIEVKSGTTNSKEKVIISSHRLTRFNSDFNQINSFLRNKLTTQIISMEYDEANKRYIIRYFDSRYLKPESNIKMWVPQTDKKGILARYEQTNKYNVILKIYIKMSWQLWLEIPTSLVHQTQIINY